MSDVKVRTALSQDDLSRIVAEVATAPNSFHAVIRAVRLTFDVLLREVGKTWADVTEGRFTLDPTAYQIPDTQHGAIGQAVMARVRVLVPNSDIEPINACLDWQNYGPSWFTSCRNISDGDRCTKPTSAVGQHPELCLLHSEALSLRLAKMYLANGK